MNVTLRKKEIIVIALYILMIFYMAISVYDILAAEGPAQSVESMYADGADVTAVTNLLIGGFNGALKIVSAMAIMLLSLIVSLVITFILKRKVLCTVQDLQGAQTIGKIILIVSVLAVVVDFIMCGVDGIIWSFFILLPIPVFYYWLVVRYLKKKDIDLSGDY